MKYKRSRLIYRSFGSDVAAGVYPINIAVESATEGYPQIYSIEPFPRIQVPYGT